MAYQEVNLSASQAVRRIVKGDTLSLYFETNGVPLFQGFDPNTYAVTPTWSAEDGKHPEITPKVESARKNSVSLVDHAWKYNGSEIKFNSGTGWVTSTNYPSTFKLNTTDGTLAIIGNLASKTNQDSDILTYNGNAMLSASVYPMEQSIDVLVSMLGASSYFGGINATTTALSKETTETTLTAWLFNGSGGNVAGFTCKVYRGSESDETYAGEFGSSGSITVHRDKTGDADKLYVDSHQLFIVVFYVNGSAVFRGGISIDDVSDLYQLTLVSDGEVSESTAQTFKCKIYKTSSSGASEVTPQAAEVTWTILDNSLAVKRTATQDWATMLSTGLVVADADTKDNDGNIISVTVNCEVTATV